MTKEEILALENAKRQAGLQIDPTTAVVEWWYVQTLDPYGYGDLPEELHQVERGYFARSPDSDDWVHFSDLPLNTRESLWNRHSRNIAFPAGLMEVESEAKS